MPTARPTPSTHLYSVREVLDRVDPMAVSVISLYMKEDLCTAVVSTYEDPIISLALRTLANLATLYATTSPTGQFYLFRPESIRK